MAKKSSAKGDSSKSKGSLSAAEHRKMANTLQAKARIHSAKADLAEALNPPKPGSMKRGYPYC